MLFDACSEVLHKNRPSLLKPGPNADPDRLNDLNPAHEFIFPYLNFGIKNTILLINVEKLINVSMLNVK